MACSRTLVRVAVSSVLALAARPASSATEVGLAVESGGTVLVASTYTDSLVRVNPLTGAVSVVSAGDSVGSGPPLRYPHDVVMDADGSLIVLNGGGLNVLRVDPVSGDRTEISGGARGSGPAFRFPRAIALAADRSILVTDSVVLTDVNGFVYHVDPTTGDRTLVSSASRGTGPALRLLNGLVEDVQGDLLVTEGAADAVMRVEVATGDRTTVSDEANGEGVAFLAPRGLALDEDGSLLVTRGFAEPSFCVSLCPHPLCAVCLSPGGAVIRTDPATGDRVLVSGGGVAVETGNGILTPYFGRVGRGPMFRGVNDVEQEAAGSLLVTYGSDDFVAEGLMRIDPVTGRRRVVAQFRGGASSARFLEGVRHLEALDARRIHRPSDPRAWLRSALGRDYPWLAGRPLGAPFSELSPAQRQRLGERLYSALRRTMRDVLEHAATNAVAP